MTVVRGRARYVASRAWPMPNTTMLVVVEGGREPVVCFLTSVCPSD